MRSCRAVYRKSSVRYLWAGQCFACKYEHHPRRSIFMFTTSPRNNPLNSYVSINCTNEHQPIHNAPLTENIKKSSTNTIKLGCSHEDRFRRSTFTLISLHPTTSQLYLSVQCTNGHPPIHNASATADNKNLSTNPIKLRFLTSTVSLSTVAVTSC
jgi:hypothetical protein